MSRRPFDAVVGLRQANLGSGVGLFNQMMAERLGVPYRLLDNVPLSSIAHPLLSLKFEELNARQESLIGERMVGLRAPREYSLFLHTFSGSDMAWNAVCGASHVFCGNAAIYRTLAQRGPQLPLSLAFAPSLIRDEYRLQCTPAPLELFSFGMASKVDQFRFARLRDMLDQAGLNYRMLCSLSVHQVSDGRCMEQALAFLLECFGDRLVPMGTLSDQGIAYFLNGERVFVGFYRDGVRANNTTFNTALRFGSRILTNLDADSPVELQGCNRLLDFDACDCLALTEFLTGEHGEVDTRIPEAFSWERLVSDLLNTCATARVRAA